MGGGVTVAPANPVQAQRGFAANLAPIADQATSPVMSPSPLAAPVVATCAPVKCSDKPGPFKPVAIAFVIGFGVLLIAVLIAVAYMAGKSAAGAAHGSPLIKPTPMFEGADKAEPASPESGAGKVAEP